jgi:aminoglycoside phosphotransferase
MTKLLVPIEGFAADAVGRLQAVTDRSWPRDGSNVWEVVNDDGEHFYLKQHSTALFHKREVTAYRRWTAVLGLGRAAVSLAADGNLRSMVITALPGRPAVTCKCLTTPKLRSIARRARYFADCMTPRLPPAVR